MNPYLLLFCAIVCEVIATTSMKASDGFSRLLPSVMVFIGYSVSFYLFSIALRAIPLGVAYAIWSGLGTVGAVVVGIVIWHELITPLRLIGIVLVIMGVVLLNIEGIAH